MYQIHLQFFFFLKKKNYGGKKNLILKNQVSKTKGLFNNCFQK